MKTINSTPIGYSRLRGLPTGLPVSQRSTCSFLTWLLIAFALPAFNQQTPVFSATYFNKFMVNPAFTGIDNQYRAFAFYRSQWGDVPMRPVTAGATAEGSFWKDKVGIGLEATNDQAGIFNETTVALSYAQKIPLAKNHQLSIGITGEMIMNKINFSAASPHDAADPGIAALQPNRTVFDFGLGIAYSYKSALLVGFSVPDILQPNAKYVSTGSQQSNFQYLRYYTGFAQYRIKLLNGKFNITPTLVIRKAQTSGLQADGTVLFDYKNIVFAGGGYRNSFGVIAMAGVNILNTVTLAYAYDYTTQPVLNGQVGSTHEIVLGFHLPSDFRVKKKMKEPPVIPSDQVLIKQSGLDSLNKNAASLDASLTLAQHVIDSLAAEAIAKRKKSTADSLAGIAKVHRNSQLSKDSEELNSKNRMTLKPVVKAEKLSNNIDLNDEKMAGQAIKLDKISFEYKQYRLLPQSAAQLDTLVSLLKRFPKTRILITGYTDNIGSDKYNTELSAKRARAVANYLIDGGINPNRLRVQGLGNQNPAADNSTGEGRNMNRRVEFTIER